MKAVLISIQPKYVKLIMDGDKTIEVRKTYPKLETPFKCYLYCTSKKPYLYKNPNNGELFFDSDEYRGGDYEGRFLSGKVVGEFICKKIEKWEEHYEEGGFYYSIDFGFNENICLDNWELSDYAKGKPIYGWHISDLKIYDKPKELSEFGLTRAPQSWCHVEEKK